VVLEESQHVMPACRSEQCTDRAKSRHADSGSAMLNRAPAERQCTRQTKGMGCVLPRDKYVRSSANGKAWL
jgi:hypothetical protein